MNGNTMAHSAITASDFQRVLEGVATAVKAPDDVSQRVRTWIVQVNVGQHPHSLFATLWSSTLVQGHPDADREALQLLRIVLAVARLRHQSRNDLSVSAADLDLIWTLISDALTSPWAPRLSFTVSRSAQGFLAVPLCSLLEHGDINELVRLHVWIPDEQRGIKDIAIHSHQPFAQSWILAGQGTDHRYTVDAASDPSEATHSEYAPQWSDGKQVDAAYKTHQQSSTVVNTGRRKRVRLVCSAEHSRNMSYAVPAGAYHSSDIHPTTFHATLFYFDSSRGFFKEAGVVGPMHGTQSTQIRDAAGVTAMALAQMVDAVRALSPDTGVQHSLSIAYWRYFHGIALLNAGKRVDALQMLTCPIESSPLQQFCRASSEMHRNMIATLIEAGVDLDVADAHGLKPLDYAVSNGDEVTKALIMRGLRQQFQSHEKAETKVSRRLYEAVITKHSRELFEEHFKPILRQRRHDGLEHLRRKYAEARAANHDLSSNFDGLRFVAYRDFCSSSRLPRYMDGNVQTFSVCAGTSSSSRIDHIVFISYRWIWQDPATGKTAPDDKNHTVFRRMRDALEAYLTMHPSVDRDKLGIWMDSSCIDRKQPLPGIAALPMNLAQCNALLILVDEQYWSRAWCAVEALIFQVLCRSYGYHRMFEYRVRSGTHDEDDHHHYHHHHHHQHNYINSHVDHHNDSHHHSTDDHNNEDHNNSWVLTETPPDDFTIDLSQTQMTWEDQRATILFLEKQAALLAE